MRITQALNRQHLGFAAKKLWWTSSKRKIADSGVASLLNSKGIKVSDPKEYLQERQQCDRKKLDYFNKPKPIQEIEKHETVPEEPTFVYNNTNVLVEGVKQAQVLLKTLKFDQFPEKIADAFEKLKLPADIERSMQQSVLVSHLLDSEQVKMRKIKDPERPMFNFPRNYGISDERRNLLFTTRLLNHCERYQGNLKARDRKRVNDANFRTFFERNGHNVQINITTQTFMTSRKPLTPFKIQLTTENCEMPDIFPMLPTVSIPQAENFVKKITAYPIKNENSFSHPHTIFLDYSDLKVKNLYGLPVNETQFESRAIVEAFAVAASRAKSLYGLEVKELETPIPIQVVQLDGKKIQFGIFQLNTLDLNSSGGVKNYWFSMPITHIYENCHYDNGRPALTNYNFDVFKMMNVFYSN